MMRDYGVGKSSGLCAETEDGLLQIPYLVRLL
jgi:hypothetical protein